MWKVVRALLGGAWGIASAIPLWAWAGAAVALWAWNWHSNAVDAARAAGDNAARRELAVPLMQAHAAAARNLADMSRYYTQASLAEGRALEFERGLNRCVGARTSMDLITSAVLRGREQQRLAAVQQLSVTQQELAHAYESSADRCADQPVPDAVIRVLDAAAFGAPAAAGAAGADAGRGDSGPEVRARTVSADGSDPGAPEAGTAYRDLADWIATGWAAALSSCNADKASNAALRDEP